MSEKLNHTPLPWKVNEELKDCVTFIAADGMEENLFTENAEGYYACQTYADARFIVQACNSHEELVEALKAAERCLTELYPSEPCKAEHEAEYYAVNTVINKARAALQRAGGTK